MIRPLLIVDGDNFAHRAYHAMPKSTVAPDGSPINAIVGFVAMVARIHAEEKPRGVFVAWDTLGTDTYRSALWPEYQTGRIFEADLIRQLEQLPTLCTAFGFGVGRAAGYEADDLIASAVAAERGRGGDCLVLTADRDAYQLVSDRVTVLAPRRGARALDRITPLGVVERLGVLPEQVPDFKALCGDASDKIPGIRGIGPKSAATLLLRLGTLENVVKEWDPALAERAFMFREVVRMRPEAAINLPAGPPDWSRGAEALRTLGSFGLADRLAAL